MAANMHNDYADRKNGRKPITYLHPDLAEVLSDTYGLMIYQESMLRVAQRFAGYSLIEAETLRKGSRQKSPRDNGQGTGKVCSRLRGDRVRDGHRYGAVRHNRAVCRLCVRQEPRIRLRAWSPIGLPG